jgi:hypothetical protein
MKGEFLSPEEMRKVVADALSDFAKHDMELLHVGVQEETLSHRLAIYIERRLDGWQVDCEYNRDLRQPKMNTEGSGRIRPDIIAHKRNSPRNLLVVEVKKTSHTKQKIGAARTRVREFTSKWSKHPRYCHGVVLVFPVQRHEAKVVRCEWFHRDGCGAMIGGDPTTVTQNVSLSKEPEL